MHLIRTAGLPETALAAAARFHAEVLPQVLAEAPQHILLVFEPADYTHRDWRLAAVRQLARDCAPARVNAVVSGDDAAIAAAARYLAAAEGVTGQLLPLDGIGAGEILSGDT